MRNQIQVSYFPDIVEKVEYLEEARELKKRVVNLPNGSVKDSVSAQLDNVFNTKPEELPNALGGPWRRQIQLFLTAVKCLMADSNVSEKVLKDLDHLASNLLVSIN